MGPVCLFILEKDFGEAPFMYYVYMLKVTDKKGKESLYTGSTNNLMRRFSEHSTNKGARYTRGRSLELVYYEIYETRSAAMKREYEIKKMSSKDKWHLVRSAGIK